MYGSQGTSGLRRRARRPEADGSRETDAADNGRNPMRCALSASLRTNVEAATHDTIVIPAQAGIQYAAAHRSIIGVSGILDPRLRGDDS